MLIKFLLLALALATPSFGRRHSKVCTKFVEKEYTLTFDPAPKAIMHRRWCEMSALINSGLFSFTFDC
jgi:hypothetical protein